MGFFKGLKTAVFKLDFFYTAQVLRYKQEPEYRTIFGGILSISIIILLLSTFYNKVFDTFQKVIIKSTQSTINANDPTTYTISTMPANNFMLGVQIWHHNLNRNDTRFFDVRMLHAHFNTGQYNLNLTRTIPLQPCTRQHWRQYPNIINGFTRLRVADWLCIPLNSQFDIKGKYSSANSKTIQIEVRKCTNSSEFTVPCAPQTTIDQLFANQTNFYYTIYFINPLINPDNQQFLNHYLEDSNYAIFSATQGQQCQLMMEDYTINTDQSIIPLASTNSTSGGIISKNCIKNRYTIDPANPLYATFYIYKSPISKTITRTFQKIDQILSYIGGLFGTIVISLFFINLYNQYSFEIAMGGYLFKPDDQQMGKQLRKYNFLYYLLHLVYIVTDLVGCQCNWPSTKLYNDCREEMVKQLDILYLFRRIHFMERAIGHLLTEKQLTSLHLIQNRTLAQAKKDRRKFKWNNEVFVYKMAHRNEQILESNQTFMKKQNEECPNILKSPRNDILEQGELQNSNDQPIRKAIHEQRQKVRIPNEFQLSSDSEEEKQDQLDRIMNSVALVKEESMQSKVSARIWTQLSRNIHILTENQPYTPKIQNSRMEKEFEKIVEEKQLMKAHKVRRLPSIINTQSLQIPSNQVLNFNQLRKKDDIELRQMK